VARVLLAHECLIPEKGRAFDCKPRIPTMLGARCYRIPARVFELDL
jgi:putative DNA primase/helicase